MGIFDSTTKLEFLLFIKYTSCLIHSGESQIIILIKNSSIVYDSEILNILNISEVLLVCLNVTLSWVLIGVTGK